MQLTIRAEHLAIDVDITVVDPAVPIGEVVSSITGRAAGSTVYVDDWPYRATDAVGAVPLRNGSVVADVLTVAPDRAGALVQIAGEGSGRSQPLDLGTYDVGAGFDGVVDAMFRLEISDVYAPRIRRLGNEPVAVDGEPLVVGEARDGELITVCHRAFRAEVGPERRPRPLSMSDTGRLPYRRAPRDQSTTTGTEPPAPPKRPDEEHRPQPFSWVVAFAPIPIAIVVALLFSPFFLVFMLMSPMLAAGRWYEGKRRAKKDRARFRADVAAAVDTYRTALRSWRQHEGRNRWARSPDLLRLAARARTAGPGLWERRPDHADHLRVTVGVGDVVVATKPSGVPELDAVAEREARLNAVPIDVDLCSELGIGIVGDAASRRRIAAALVTELALTHGPSDLGVVALLDPATVGTWDWCKWLPHLEDERGFRRLATTAAAGTTLLTALPLPDDQGRHRDQPPLGRPATIVVVDGAEFLHGSFTALSTAVRSGSARAIVLADDLADLPAICTTVVRADEGLGPDRCVTVQSLLTGVVTEYVVPVAIDGDTAASIARHLSAFSDPDRTDDAADLPASCDLRSLVACSLEPDAIAARWACAGSRHPRATLGAAAQSVVGVDLVTDGPHALIAGTTGSGKSELLRTLVAGLAIEQGPDQLTFVLVDFKGGGAFDACGDLPHTVGVVTDLDEHLAARALRCLKAELRYREQRLRDAGVSDLRDYDPGDEPLPRLVVVIDEFATLAAELPDFMASLVDIAQRGRSLGIHLILATQRPAGVVDAKIRANTNLRISLRVQDDADSLDVIGDKRAAVIDRRSPGRAYLRLGASELTLFQTAIVSRCSTTIDPLPLRVTTFELGATTPPTGSDRDLDGTGLDGTELDGTELGDDGSGAETTTDLEVLATSAGAAAVALGTAEPRVPWPAPLPLTLDAGDLDAGDLDAARIEQPWSTPIGLIDKPDEQRVDTFWWTPEVGNLLCFGADATATSMVIQTIIAGLAAGNGPGDLHAYVLDFSGGGALSRLGALPHVGAVVTPRDEERLGRVLDLLEAELDARAERARSAGLARLGPGDGVPLVMLAVANFGGFLALVEETQQFELGSRVERLVRDGAELGLFTVLTANHERGIPSRLAGQVESRLIMRMADPTSYTAFGLRTRDMPTLGAGRAIDVATGAEVQIAETTIDPDAAASGLLARLTGRLAGGPSPGAPSAGSRGGGPPAVEVLADDIDPAGVVRSSVALRDGLRLAVGLRHRDLEPAAVDLRPGTNLVVSGGPGSGKTTALRALVTAALTADDGCQIVTVGSPDEWPSAMSHVADDLIEPDRRTLLVIDGLATVDDVSAQALERLSSDRTWVVVADRPELLLAAPHWLRRLMGARAGLLLQPRPDHGEVLRCRLPARQPSAFPPGRGYLVEAGAAEVVQLVNATTTDPAVTATGPSGAVSDRGRGTERMRQP